MEIKKNQEKENNILLVRRHPSVLKTRRSNWSQNGDANSMFFGQNINCSLLHRSCMLALVSMLSSSGVSINLQYFNVAPVWETKVNILAKNMLLTSSF